MARALAVAAAIAISLLAVSGAGGAPAQTPKRGGSALFAPPFGGEPACVTPYVKSCFGGTTNTGLDPLPSVILLGAFEVGPDLTWRKRLVSGVDFTTVAPFTLTYHIRPEAMWSDGRPVTAGDFVFTVRTLRQLGAQIDDSEARLLARIRSIRAVDRTTATVRLRSRYAGWRRLFSAVLPRHVLAGQDYTRVWQERIDNPKTGEPIGSGPFLLQRWERGRRLVLGRNTRYWGPHTAYLDRLVWPFELASDSAREAFRSGLINFAWGFPPEAIRAFLRDIPGITIYSGPSPAFEHFAIRVGAGGHRALRHKLVRRALALGIDREAIVHEIFGQVVPAQRLTDSAVFLNSSASYRRNWGQYRYRPADARRLLEQAGCTKDPDGIYSCFGDRLSLQVYTRAGFGRRVTTVELIVRQLARIGVEVRPVYADAPVLFGQILPSGRFDMMLLSALGAPPDEYASDRFRCGGPDNLTGYCQRLVTADLNQADRIMDPERRVRALNRADRRLARDVPIVPLYWTPSVAAASTVLRGYVFHPDHPFWGAENWWLER